MYEEMESSNQSINQLETLNGIRSERMVGVLTDEIARVRSVKDWAKEAEVSESSLYRVVSDGYGKTPGEILKEVRFEKVIKVMVQNAEVGAYCIALDSGFGSEAALRMFLRRRFDTNIRVLRRKILSGNLRMKWIWLNGNG